MGGYDTRPQRQLKGSPKRTHSLEELSTLLDIPLGILEAWRTHYV